MSNKENNEIADNPLTKSILEKFEIEELNPMQLEAGRNIRRKSDVVLLSPTGTGKTLAFLLPLIETLDPDSTEIQILIVVPSRELAQQLLQVARDMGSGFKVNAVYGGRAGSQDKLDLKHRPAILIGTPGRLADRFFKDTYSLDHIKVLVLDEFDKSLEMGYEDDMIDIIESLPNVEQRILTSATRDNKIPKFVGLQKPVFINYADEGVPQLTIKTILAPDKNKLKSLEKTLAHIGPKPGIIFCSFKDELYDVSEYLDDHDIHHECFHGDMEQLDREQALIKFRNGTTQILLATDLAARGLDIPELAFILHYRLPLRYNEFLHRNGRTARMNSDGVAYILHWTGEDLPEYIENIAPEEIIVGDLQPSHEPSQVRWVTLYITGGRREKISKGDIAGLFMKQGKIDKDQLGVIELQENCSYVSVHANIAQKAVEKTNNTRLKKKKVRISIV
ncbi:MAG: DEAD/DEAH box helicase [Candidatus Kapaibacterium sp.]